MTDNPDPIDATAGGRRAGAIPHWLAFVLLTLVAAMWAGSSIAGRAASGNVPPMTLSFLRWAGAFVLFLPFGARPLWRERRVFLRHWKVIAAFSFFGVVGFTVPYYVGLQFTPAINVAILNGSGPVLTILVSFAMLGIVVSWRQAAGIALAAVGVIMIVVRGSLAILLGLDFNIGDMLALAAYLSWAFYTVMLWWKPPGVGPYSFLVAVTGLACLMMAPLYLWELSTGRGFVASGGNLIIVGYAAVFPSFLCYLFWNLAVPAVGANVAAITQYLSPVFGVIFAILILGEALENFHLVGVAMIFAGLYLSSWRTGGIR